jgi:hypothetical protein
MPIKLANNASGTLATAINASDIGIVLTTGDGAEFPTLGAGDYFYATLTSTQGTQEIVKVTARSGDSLTIVRAQEGTSAAGFAAGARFELRVTAASVDDIVEEVRTELAAASGASLVGFIQSGSGATARTAQAKLRDAVHVRDFDAVGNDTDETTKLLNAVAAATGGTLWFEPNKIYRATSAIVVPEGTSLELNGSTIKFVVTGDKNCLDLRSKVTIRNGSVTLAGSGYTGHGGNGCPIVIGEYGVGTGYTDIRVENVTITSNKTDGNGVAIVGGSSNIVLRNITITGPNNLGCAVLAHWGGANNPSAGTTHPNKILLENIQCGTMSLAGGLGITLSGAYDVTVNNVTFDNTVQHAVYVFCGDYGMLYATDANIKAHGVHNIKISNVTGVRVGYGVYVDMFRNLAPTPAKETSRNIVFENCSFRGNAPTTSTKFGVRLRYTDNVVFRNCVFDNFYHNAVISLSSNGNTFDSCQFLNSRVQSVVNWITGETSSTPSVQNQFTDCLFKGSNQSTTAAIADINLQWGGQNVIRGCRFDSSLSAQNVRVEGGVNSSYGNMVTNNLIVTPPTSACFSFGASSDYSLVTMFAENQMLNNGLVPVNGFATGQLLLPFAATPRAGQNRVAYKLVGAAVPVGGTWTVGDTVFFNAPTAGGSIGAVCVAEGTPGTWKTFGAISA